MSAATADDRLDTLSHLLDPLRELSIELDLAGELEEYLQAINVDESVLVNFAQAALLVQQSSALYSKKVEHLYTLVLETLAHLQSTDVREQGPPTGGKQTASKKLKTNDGRAPATAHGASDSSRALLTLADMNVEANQINWTVRTHVEESTKIDLPPPHPAMQQRRDLDKSTNTKTFQASMVMMGSFVSMDNDSGESLKLKSCRVDPQTGALYLDESSKDLLAFSRRQVVSATPSTTATQPLQRSVAPVLTPVREDDDAEARSRLSYEVKQDGADDNNEPDFGWNAEDLNEEAEPVATTENKAKAWGNQDRGAFSPALPGMATESHGDGHHDDHPDDDDPWQLLDAYEAKDCVVRPFRKGPTFRGRLPNVAKLAHASIKGEPIYTPVPPGRAQHRRLDRLRHQLLSKPFKLFTDTSRVGRSLPATTPLHTEYAKCFAKLQPLDSNPFASKKRRNSMIQDEGGRVRRMDAKPEADDDDCVDFDDGYAHDYDSIDDKEGHDDIDDVPTVKKAPQPSPDDTPVKEDEDGISISRHLNWSQKDEKDGDPSNPTSYEALCKLHIKQFMEGTEEYMKETRTTKKVAEWQRRLTPLLDEQNRRPPFDIKASGDTIVHKLVTTPTTQAKAPVGFDCIVQDMSSWEICRIFSAVLHLANQGSVDLDHNDDDVHAGMDSLRLTMHQPPDANKRSTAGMSPPRSRRQRKRP
ncbi:hypothetical protein, variant 1 [Aphanomyces invadans]|uniref:Condensin II complex subunit H2 N-terminal domain-containing protein n=1 Tax=Aphanomyces invadans TaxID=157072 RepID=A0A024TFS2_9STRA|nr:hypothetical protein, variant 1 [Aphanomyces invadans]ETV92416.1 hypothetical protein, variant 1 [Aphanomyces invadans]|eukprot:XP_008878968.1 hypothetical protein, variant 1 [Aphanomyces invadans]